MVSRQFPALGFDPAPGDPGVLSDAAGSVAAAGWVFGDASGSVSGLDSAGWTGAAGDGFRGRLADLPRDLDLAAGAHRAAARALSGYGSGLVGRQRRAGELEARAAELVRRRAAAVAEVNRIAGQTAPAGSAELAGLRSRYAAAASRADALDGELAQVLADARRLHGEHRSAAAEAAAAIRGVAEAPYAEPGWLSRAWDAATGWIGAHADVLTGISTVLKGVSAVLGVLCLVPGLQFLAPFALLTAGAALLIDVGIKLATGDGSWTAIGIDAALTVLPGGRILRGLKGANTAARSSDHIARALTSTDDAARGLRSASNSAQGARLAEHYRYWEKYGSAGYRELQSGRLRYYGELRPAARPGEMAGRRLVREWDPVSGATRTWHETLDHAGRVRQVRPVRGTDKVHYRFDENGEYLGSW